MSDARREAMAALVIPGQPLMTARDQLLYLVPSEAVPVAFEEIDRRRKELGMDEVDAMRSVIDDVHNGRWTP